MSVLERWHHKVHEVSRAGIMQHREASPELCVEIAAELDVPACHSLVADYRIRNAGKGRFELSGRVQAEFTRTCVITLEPIAESIDEPLNCAFVPPDHLPDDQVEEEEALSVEEYEPIERDRIEVGRIIYEVVAAGIDPYPRAPDAALEQPGEPAETHEPTEHPFAALSRLKAAEDDTK